MRFVLTLIIIAVSIAILIAGWFMFDRLFLSKQVSPKIDNSGSKHEQAIQIEILNSTKQDGLASKMMDYLRKRGFDVVRVGNYTTGIEKKSLIIERNLSKRTASNVALALGIPDSCIFIKPDTSLFLNCTVVIGNDYNKLLPFK